MSDDIREYRLARPLALRVTLVTGAALLLAGVVFTQTESEFDHYAELFLVATLGSLGLAFAWYLLTAVTRTTDEGLTISGFRTRTTPWSQVATIRIERGTFRLTTYDVAVVYDLEGRRRVLPNVNDHNRIRVTDEVERLKDSWLRKRGRGWSASTAFSAVRRAQQPKPVRWLRVYWYAIALEFVIAVCVVLGVDLRKPELTPASGVDVVLGLTILLALVTTVVLPVQRYRKRPFAEVTRVPKGKRQR